jgi:hypothetical protein
VFNVMAENTLLSRRAELAGGVGEAELPKWSERRDEILLDTTCSYKTAFIFGGLTFGELKSWLKPLASCPVSTQRAIFLWVLNRTAGHWKVCRHCRLPGATKAHLESCALHLTAVPVGPSQLEDRLCSDPPTEENFAEIAQLITRCVGETPLAVNQQR